MPDRLPARLAQAGQAVRAQEQTELAVYEHALQARYLAECDCIDSQAVADVVRETIEQELTTFDYGLGLAQGSVAKVELVTRLVSLQANLDNRRIAQRFGR